VPATFQTDAETDAQTGASHFSEEIPMTAHQAADPLAPPPAASRDDARYAAAYRRVQELRGFYCHATWFVLVMPVLALINALASPGQWWVLYPLLGWGFGLTVHALSVFAGGRFLGREWQERKIRQILEREGGDHVSH
jgi:hypothetical protein